MIQPIPAYFLNASVAFVCEKMSIQYMVMGFKPTTFRTRVSSHNH